MNIDNYFNQVVNFVHSDLISASKRRIGFDESLLWPKKENQIILNSDTAIELGHPQDESQSFLLWTESGDKVNDGCITVIGRELSEVNEPRISFGKIVLLKVHGFDDDNSYERYREMDMVKFKLNLDGYMLRALPRENREWSRVSLEAMNSGFSLQVLGNEHIREFRNLEYVDAVEIIFITSSKEDILNFKPAGEKVVRIISAMNRIFDNIEFDCLNCDFSDVCDEIDGLKMMHKKAGIKS